MSIAEKLTTVAENVPKVYKAGQDSMVDPDKIIPKTASSNPIYLDDVSEIPHDVGITLSSDTITDFSDVNVTVCGKNLLDIENGAETTYPVTIEKIENGYKITNNSSAQCNMYYPIKADNGNYAVVASWTMAYAPRIMKVNKTTLVTLSNNVSSIFNTTENLFYFRITLTANESGTITFAQVKKGSTVTNYEPYNGTIYTANADGTVEGVKSLSPYMNVYSDSDVDLFVDYRKSYGVQTEYDRFWDIYQDNGNRASYYMAFAGVGWTDETFKPKYDIKPSAVSSIFYNSRITDIVKCLEKSGITLDSSSCTDISSMFSYSTITHAPIVSAKAVWSNGNANNVFSNAKNLISVEKFIFVQTSLKKTCMYDNCFSNCSSLREIRFEGEVYRSLDLTASPLSVDSMKSLISCLGDYSTESTGVYTVGFSESCWTALEADSTAPDGKTWRNYVETTLGWLT